MVVNMYTSFEFASPDSGRVHTLHVHTLVDDDAEQTLVRIGFPTQQRSLAMACVFFIVPHDATEPIDLQWVGFKPTCASPDIGGGTTLMKAAIQYIFETFSGHSEGIQLTDDSKLTTCKTLLGRHAKNIGGGRDITVPLAYHNILLYGQTWYQRHFGAYVVSYKPEISEENVSKLNEIVNILKSSKERTGFDDWFETYVLSMTNGRRGFEWASCDDMRNAIESVYTQTDTWTEFFQGVNARCGCGIFFVLVETVLRNSTSQGGMGLNMGTWTFQIPRSKQSHAQSHAGNQHGAGSSRRNNAARAYFRHKDRTKVLRLPIEL